MRLKQVRRTDVITSLRSFDGSTSSYSPGELLDTSTQFYSHLYRHKPTTPPDHERPLSFIDNSLSSSAQQRLEEPFDMDELATAAFKSSRGKTPGVDGLPSEFYKLTWSETGPILLEILNQTAITGRLSSSQSIAQFHLIYKKGDKDDIRNYRPIALINTDARIISGAINSRLLEQIHLVVHPDQTAFIPNRWIGSNIAQLQSLVDEEKTHPGIIAQVDFEKAYDNVSHDFIEPCLRKMGFGTLFIDTIKSTYSHQFGRICLNGWVGESFPLLSGVRQGNPLAPSIFSLIFEPLAAMLRARLRGIPRLFSPFKVSAFADDLGAGCRDYDDVDVLDLSLEEYEKGTAMIVSRPKSFLHPIGTFATNPPPSYKTWAITTEAFTSLGVPIGRNVDANEVWNEKVKKVGKRLSSIPFHDLPLASRCSIINIYCYSMIVYLDRFLPCPGPILDQLHRASLDAIWRNSSSVSVNEHRLCTPQVHGGFGLISLKNRLAGPRAEWIYRLLTIPESSKPFVVAIRGRLQKYLLLHPAHQWNYDPFSFQRELSPSFQWTGIFFQPGAFSGGWPGTMGTMTSLLPSRWKDYLAAWNSIITLTPFAKKNWNDIALRPPRSAISPITTKHLKLSRCLS